MVEGYLMSSDQTVSFSSMTVPLYIIQIAPATTSTRFCQQRPQRTFFGDFRFRPSSKVSEQVLFHTFTSGLATYGGDNVDVRNC